MDANLHFHIKTQPDDTTCGPTCLHAVYNYYGDIVPLEMIISQVRKLKGGGTLAVMLGCHALNRGYRAKLYTYNLKVFDPTWFVKGSPPLIEKLKTQLEYKPGKRFQMASKAYMEFLRLGGKIYFEDLTSSLIRGLLKRSVPVLTGLSATYLFRSAREVVINKKGSTIHDDIKGEASGHFVIICGYDKTQRTALVADPYLPNPFSDSHIYSVPVNRLICAIMLGILTYDANLLVITPPKPKT